MIKRLIEKMKALRIYAVMRCKILLCRKHIWSNDMSKPEIWRMNSGWLSLGGFPECEYRKCIKCDKYEER
jgi:hypothetical protein